MTIPVIVVKEQLAYYLDCINNGKAIEAPKGGWNGYDLLTLAGVCFFGRMSHGPASLSDFNVDDLPPEHREAVYETFNQDLHIALEWYGHKAELVADDKYDDEFERALTALLYLEDGKKCMLPVRGFRRHPDVE